MRFTCCALKSLQKFFKNSTYPLINFLSPFHLFFHLMFKQTTINNVQLQSQQRNIAILDHHGVEQQEQHENYSTNGATSKYSFKNGNRIKS